MFVNENGIGIGIGIETSIIVILSPFIPKAKQEQENVPVPNDMNDTTRTRHDTTRPTIRTFLFSVH